MIFIHVNNAFKLGVSSSQGGVLFTDLNVQWWSRVSPLMGQLVVNQGRRGRKRGGLDVLVQTPVSYILIQMAVRVNRTVGDILKSTYKNTL